MDTRKIDGRARTRRDFLRIDKPVSTNPDLVIRVGQVGHEVASLIIGDDGTNETRTEVTCLGDDPDARLGAVGTRYDARDVVIVDRNRRSGRFS